MNEYNWGWRVALSFIVLLLTLVIVAVPIENLIQFVRVIVGTVFFVWASWRIWSYGIK